MLRYKLLKNILLAGLLFISSLGVLKAQELTQLLDPNIFSFEDDGEGIYYQQTGDYWSISSEKSAGSGTYSLKYSSTETPTEVQKAKFKTGDYAINLPAGDYTLKVKVWLAADAEITAFTFIIKSPWTTWLIQIDTIKREEWVEISFPVSFETDIVNSASHFVIGTAQIGLGTMYIDDLEIWGEKQPDPLVLPFISSISTVDESNINLYPGIYDVKMKCWKDTGTSISIIYSSISEPWASLQWDISTISEGEWVELVQELILADTTVNSEFSLKVNNDPSYGGGSGGFYLDDIEFILKDDFIAVSGLNLAASELLLNVNDSSSLEYTIIPGDATNKEVSWLSDNSGVASVDSNGLVIGVSIGETMVSAYSSEGSFVESCRVIVELAVEGIILSDTAITIDMGDQYILVDSIFPANASHPEVTWASEADDIAKVDGGLLTGVSAGKTRIHVNTVEGDYSAYCSVTVQDTSTTVSEQLLDQILFSPNPFSRELAITGNLNKYQEIRLYKITGEIMLIREIDGHESIILTPSYDMLPAGIYLLKLLGKQGAKTARLIRHQ